MLKNTISIVCLATVLTACAGDKSVKVVSLQKKDKDLSCSEVQLEINEAEFYRNTAENNKNPDLKSLLMPIGYISTYVNAGEASEAAEARVKYLNRIYDILDCDNPNSAGHARPVSSGYQRYGAVVQPQYAPVHSSQDYYHQSPVRGSQRNGGDDWYY